MVEIFKSETVDILSRSELKIIQKKDGYRFSLDAVLLADFASKFILAGASVLELGTGSGVIPITLASKIEDIRIIGLEIQEELCEMAKRSIKLNNLEDKIKIIKGDLKESSNIFKGQKFDIVIANPPYRSKKSGRINMDLQKAIARHELECNLKELVRAGSFLTKVKGRFILIYSPERIGVLISELRANGLEPKHIRFIHSFPHSEAKMVLIESVKGGRPGVKVLPPLMVYKGRGDYSEEVKKVYHFW